MSNYMSEQQRRRQLWDLAPKECPYCRERNETTPINERFPEFGSERPRYHCGSDRCRKAHSRAVIAERKKQARIETRAKILDYCNKRLDADQRQAVMAMCDLLMAYDYDHGHEIAGAVIAVMDAKRCKHDRLDQIEAYAAIWKRKAEATEQQLKARIQELEEELEVFTTLESTIHGIVQRQLQKQPEEPDNDRPALVTEPETEENDPDRPRVLEILSKLNIQPYTGSEEQTAEEARA